MTFANIILFIIIIILALFYSFFFIKDRISRVELLMVLISSLSAFTSYQLSTRENVGGSISFGIIAASALFIVGLIENKKYENKQRNH